MFNFRLIVYCTSEMFVLLKVQLDLKVGRGCFAGPKQKYIVAAEADGLSWYAMHRRHNCVC